MKLTKVKYFFESSRFDRISSIWNHFVKNWFIIQLFVELSFFYCDYWE